MTLPVAVISFNRPGYLAKVLDSLKQQTVPFGPIALFQDGARKASDLPAISGSVSRFRDRFPDGIVFHSPFNLGPGLNIDRAERWLFEDLDVDVGAIFEDDMVLSPLYIDVLQAMLAANRGDDRLAYVAAYGPIQSEPVCSAIYAPMHLNWGFAITRRMWFLRKPFVDAYLDILRTCDYRTRDIVAIMKLRESWGFPGPYTTQDVMRSAATHKVGGLRLNTRDHFARYIGARGLHIDEQAYEAAGFGRWRISGRVPVFGPISAEMARACLERTERFIGAGSEAA